MPILITGGAGFIGSHLAEYLTCRYDEPILCLDNFNDYYDPALKRANATLVAGLPRVRVIEGDFCDTPFLKDLLQRESIDRIVHLGAYAGVRYSVQNPSIYERVNIGGTLSVLESARAVRLQRLLVASSSTVYGMGAAVPFQEDLPLGIPASPYGATKRAAELMTLTYHQLHGVPAACFRPFSVYGPRLRPDLALSIFVKAIVEQRPFPLFGDGSIRRDFTHVLDICAGIDAALFGEGVVGEIFNLGHSEPIEMREIIRLLEVCLGRSAQIERRPERPEDLPVTFADLTKSRRVLGYAPQMPIEPGLDEFCRWYCGWHQVD